MFGRRFDLFFFFLSFGIGLLAFQLMTSPLVASSALFAALIPTTFGAGPFHQGPTWMMYFDAKNREWYQSSAARKAIFFAGPPLLVTLSVLGMLYFRPLIIGISLIWAIQHLVQQNVGILLLYHNHNQGEAIVERPLEVRSQQIAAIFWSLLFFRRVVIGGHSQWLVDLIIAAVGLAAGAMFVMYIWRLQTKIQAGEGLNVPAFAFWILSFCALVPLAFVGKDFAAAFLAPVTWHWFQYIGLNYRLVSNKYAGERKADLAIARPIAMFFSICLFLVAVNLGLSFASKTVPDSMAQDLMLGFILGLANCHYLLDAFMWRFREAYPRQAILPFLKVRA